MAQEIHVNVCSVWLMLEWVSMLDRREKQEEMHVVGAECHGLRGVCCPGKRRQKGIAVGGGGGKSADETPKLLARGGRRTQLAFHIIPYPRFAVYYIFLYIRYTSPT